MNFLTYVHQLGGVHVIDTMAEVARNICNTLAKYYLCLRVLQLQIEEEERKLKAAIEEAEKLYSEVTSEMKDLEIKSNQFEELEERLVSVLVANIFYLHVFGSAVYL